MPAANQYGYNFESQISQLYGKSAAEVVYEFSAQKLSYEDVAKKTGFALPTVRKWCRRYNIKLFSKKYHRGVSETAFQKMFKKNEVNYYNVLSRPWHKDREI